MDSLSVVYDPEHGGHSSAPASQSSLCCAAAPAAAAEAPYGNTWAAYRMRDVRYPDFFDREFVPENTRPYVACDAELSAALRPIQVREPRGVYAGMEARPWTGPLVEGTVHWQQTDYRPWHFTTDTRQELCGPPRMYRDTA